jgi:hypothetical protein
MNEEKIVVASSTTSTFAFRIDISVWLETLHHTLDIFALSP